MSAAKVMAYTVIVRHPETDTPTAVLAGKPVPKWANDLVHDDDLVKASGQTGESGPGDDGQDSGAVDGSTEPPRAGRGSGVEAWTAYAVALGIEVPQDATRDDVVSLVDARTKA